MKNDNLTKFIIKLASTQVRIETKKIFAKRIFTWKRRKLLKIIFRMLFLEMNGGLRPRMQSKKIVNLFAVYVSLHPLSAIRLVLVQPPLFPAKRQQTDHTMDRSQSASREFRKLTSDSDSSFLSTSSSSMSSSSTGLSKSDLLVVRLGSPSTSSGTFSSVFL